jgi:hypothetical protein
MNRRRSVVFVGVWSALLGLNVGYVYAQTQGQIPVFGPPGAGGSCNAAGGNDCVDSVISQDSNGNIGISTPNGPTSAAHQLEISGPNSSRNLLSFTYQGLPSAPYVASLSYDTTMFPFPLVLNLSNDLTPTGFQRPLSIINGNVGIGTTSPEFPLHVQSAVTFGPIFQLDAANTTGGKKWFFQSTGGDASQGQGKLIIRQQTDGFEAMAIAPSGNVGIGTLTPAFKLDVAGAAHATSFPTSSDIRLKKNVRPLTDVLEKIDKIRGVTFDWNERYEALGRSTGKREMGVVAQEVEAVFPELVTAWGEDGYRAVDYGRLAAALIEAIKEQQFQIRTLQAQLNELQTAHGEIVRK